MGLLTLVLHTIVSIYIDFRYNEVVLQANTKEEDYGWKVKNNHINSSSSNHI